MDLDPPKPICSETKRCHCKFETSTPASNQASRLAEEQQILNWSGQIGQTLRSRTQGALLAPSHPISSRRGCHLATLPTIGCQGSKRAARSTKPKLFPSSDNFRDSRRQWDSSQRSPRRTTARAQDQKHPPPPRGLTPARASDSSPTNRPLTRALLHTSSSGPYPSSIVI